MIEKIILGGQTGADQGGLEAGKELGIRTGGTAPLGWRTEVGSQKDLLEGYGLKEDWRKEYPPRTKENIHNSDGTILFGDPYSPGSKLTLRLCRELKKLWIINPTEEDFAFWIVIHNIRVLNVAGNRESKNPGIQERVRNFLVEVLKELT